MYCCSSTSWVGRLAREGWWFGRCVGGWASGFVAMCGSSVLQFCFLDPWCFRHHHYSLDDGAPRSNCGFTSFYCCTLLLYQGTAVAHGEWVFRLVGLSTCSWVGALVVASVRTWLIVCFRYCAVDGDHLSHHLLFFSFFFVSAPALA